MRFTMTVNVRFDDAQAVCRNVSNRWILTDQLLARRRPVRSAYRILQIQYFVWKILHNIYLSEEVRVHLGQFMNFHLLLHS